jgi:hypothetical protein
MCLPSAINPAIAECLIQGLSVSDRFFAEMPFEGGGGAALNTLLL